ncbi:MAG: MotA/TolQ/ExbB proton channel family protein [Kiritimatiellae bacterium]|nr:MotA/TolQ/ExbB proton channel family protein [Kiritimatiellia bacterium]
MKKSFLMSIVCAGLLCFSAQTAFSQDVSGDVAGDAPAAGQLVNNTAAAQPAAGSQNQFMQVLFGSGPVGFFLWVVLIGALVAYIYLAIDCAILIQTDKIMPGVLIANVEAAMKEGDVVKALQFCENDPTPLAHILSAGFSHVEEGFEVIDEAIASAADVEVEKIMQRLTWISVVGNLAPMMGLLGTVQGMIMAFANLAGGTPDVGALAVNISQALWTTAGGLICAIPSVATYYGFRNKANNIVLKMTIMTTELIKDLRNVEVVAE